MKDGVVIVNTARGAVMDEAALVQALDSGKVFSAGLDVFEEEPKIHPGLTSNPNVMLLPHMGTWTVEVSNTKSKIETSQVTPCIYSPIFLNKTIYLIPNRTNAW
jgi:lactate dehydrogenase-like 2-hydroxyacid dehydrogenase